MPAVKPWLEKLTLDKLHRLATAVGSPCSGTKAVRIEGIQRAVSDESCSHLSNLSLLSIDMGIKNLAFAHITAPVRQVTSSPSYLHYDKPTLQAWRRLAVSDSLVATEPGSVSLLPSSSRIGPLKSVAEASKESFEPIDYARHAYNLIRYMLQAYQPTQILIERQRFRSGGQAAVQEWTLRVGVLEGMLYSVIRTLIEERKIQLSAEPMQPPRVNRYWLEDRQSLLVHNGKKLTGRDVKRAKVEIVSNMLEEADSSIRVGKDLQPFAADFVSSCKVSKSKQVTANMSKLDDLADSLLQGLAWIHWQNNRRRVEALGRDAVDMDSGALS